MCYISQVKILNVKKLRYSCTNSMQRKLQTFPKKLSIDRFSKLKIANLIQIMSLITKLYYYIQKIYEQLQSSYLIPNHNFKINLLQILSLTTTICHCSCEILKLCCYIYEISKQLQSSYLIPNHNFKINLLQILFLKLCCYIYEISKQLQSSYLIPNHNFKINLLQILSLITSICHCSCGILKLLQNSQHNLVAIFDKKIGLFIWLQYTVYQAEFRRYKTRQQCRQRAWKYNSTQCNRELYKTQGK
eukprot:TRINITY_DN1337_c0_g1_i22.p1 TRINITY_DN1337_c0_g1~~TRINITY_DN1337_c0_g1_i22.p1  ORF type:complete len:284 (+),score=-38.97 TRINITY_DN1337_c0_g1_i22:115-852(+)